MKKVLKISLGILFLILLIGTFVFLWNKTRPVKEVYAIVKPHIDTLEKRAVATGKVEPRDEVLIKPQISGIVSEVYKQAGEPVRQGEVIAKVKVIPDMATLNAAESRVNVARINLAQTKQEFERVKGLFDSGVVAKEEFEKNETEYSKAKEELQNAQDNLEIVQNGIAKRNAELSNTQIRSTITGMVLDVPIKVGNSVILSNNFNDGTTIASVADMNNMIFRGKVDETEVGRIREGMPVKLTIGALQDISLDATLEYIAPKGTEENGVIMFEIKAAAKIPEDVFIRAGRSGCRRWRCIQRQRRHPDRPARRGDFNPGKLHRVRRNQNVRQPADQRLHGDRPDFRTQGDPDRTVERGQRRSYRRADRKRTDPRDEDNADQITDKPHIQNRNLISNKT